MKILVLENDPKELVVIQRALNSNKHILIPIFSSEQAWQYIQAGDVHFLLGNWDTSDLKRTEFLQRVRSAKLPGSLYILLTTSRDIEEDPALTGADDVLQRPYKSQELKNRVMIAERIVSLSSKLASARTQLENQALYDGLTGFMNRTAFLRQAAGEIERARRASVPLSVIAVDIENFRAIAEGFGVETAQDVLRVTAQSIREKSRPYDSVGHWVGDEFVILVVGVIGADAEKMAERIVSSARSVVVTGDQPPVNVKISAGVVSLARVATNTEIEALVQQARQSMLRAKEAGGSQVFLSYA
jgi:diguanylate cyclase (GGDEF)-like protein